MPSKKPTLTPVNQFDLLKHSCFNKRVINTEVNDCAQLRAHKSVLESDFDPFLVKIIIINYYYWHEYVRVLVLLL